MCSKCNVHLCDAYFQVYHTNDYDSSDDEDEVVKKFELGYSKLFTIAIVSLLLIQ